MHFHRKTGLPCRPVSVPLYAVLGDKCVHQRGFLRLFRAVHKAAAAEYRSGLVYGAEKPEEAPLVYALVTKDGVERY